jgi:hypothetical protein
MLAPTAHRMYLELVTDIAKIFVEHQGKLTACENSRHRDEAELQALIARHPELLWGDFPDEEAGERFLLVAREAEVPDGPGHAPRWSLDHLFVDQQGCLTLVEVKMSSNSERRRVVAQMLDYAANGARYWNASSLEQMARKTHGSAYDRVMQGFLLEGDSIGAFWLRVEEKLRAHDVRLVFVSDRLESELVAVIEFLNSSMNKVRALGVEVLRYELDGKHLLVPRTKGRLESVVERADTNVTATDFLRRLSQRLEDLGEEDLGFGRTKRPTKEFVISRVFTDLEAWFFARLGAYERSDWGSLKFGFVLKTESEEARDEWRKRLENLTKGALPLAFDVEGKHVTLVKITPWSSAEELDCQMDEAARTITALFRLLAPLLVKNAR